VINDESHGSVAIHLTCSRLFGDYNKFIGEFASKNF